MARISKKETIWFSLFSMFFLFFFTQILFPQNAPYHLRCSDKVDPVGTDAYPYFGWYMDNPEDNQIQTAYQVLVASAEEDLNGSDSIMWNSGMISSRMQNYIAYEGNPLEAGRKYFWKVKIWDKNGNESPYSEVSSFSTGLFDYSDWAGALWIKRDNADRDDYTYYRKHFSTPGESINRAVVYVAAVHDYELYLNGALVGKGPGYHYPEYQYYNAYDITDKILTGAENLFACLTHYYNEGQGRPRSAKGFLLKAVIEYADSSQTVIGTDSTWLQKRADAWLSGQSQKNGEGVGYVEKIDASLIIDDWNQIVYSDTAWSNAYEIGAHPAEPWTGELQPNLTRLIEEEITPVSVTEIGTNQYVIDLGKVYAGVPRITFTGGEAGSLLSILGGYTLKEDGSVSRDTDQGTNMLNYFILNGNTAVFQPFVYLGMRYLQVNNSPNILNTDNVSFITRHYELDPSRSDFQSSNFMLDQVWELMKHSLILGSQESFVDTPTREKGGFLGDSWSIGVPAMTTMGDRTMNRRILLEFLDSQDQYWPDGRLNAVYPNGDGARDIPDYTQMYLVWVWDYYMQTGNRTFLINNYQKLKKVADYVDTYRNETTGLIHNLDGGGGPYLYGIVDWPDQMRYGYDMSVETRTVMDAYAYMDFLVMSRIAEALDSIEDMELYRQKAETMKTAINTQLINEDGVYIDGLNSDLSQSTHVSQQANIFPMAMGIVPESYMDSVAREIKEQQMSVGMVTLRWLPEAIGMADEGRHLLELYVRTDWDGWARTISLGGTATWESWDAIEHDQSMSHPWGAVGLLGIQQYILGIRTLLPQHEQIQVKPLEFEQGLSQVSGTLPSDRGDIGVEWSRSDSLFSMSLSIPDNMTALVYVPKSGTPGTSVSVNDEMIEGTEEGRYIFVGELGSGEYEIQRQAVYQGPGVSIPPDDSPGTIKIFPNPASDHALLDLGETRPSVHVRIRSITGSSLREELFTHTRFCEIDLMDLEEGIFLITVTFDDQAQETLQLVKR